MGTYERSAVAEAYRILRVNLEALRAEHPIQALLLAPATPGEAAGEVAVGLAIAFAEAGRQTLLVDADLERPSLHTALGLAPAPGLRAWLTGTGGSVDAYLVETGIPGLSVLPAGPADTEVAPPAFARRSGELLQALRRRAERIVIYAPPAQRASRTLELAEHTDGVLLIARARATHRAHLQQAREALERGRATVLGVILWR